MRQWSMFLSLFFACAHQPANVSKPVLPIIAPPAPVATANVASTPPTLTAPDRADCSTWPCGAPDLPDPPACDPNTDQFECRETVEHTSTYVTSDEFRAHPILGRTENVMVFTFATGNQVIPQLHVMHFNYQLYWEGGVQVYRDRLAVSAPVTVYGGTPREHAALQRLATKLARYWASAAGAPTRRFKISPIEESERIVPVNPAKLSDGWKGRFSITCDIHFESGEVALFSHDTLSRALSTLYRDPDQVFVNLHQIAAAELRKQPFPIEVHYLGPGHP